MVLSIIFLEDKHKIILHLSILYEYQQFFQHRICFSIQPQLQLVNLHRNRRYFVIKLHTWFCLSYFLKTNITFYSIYQYFMSINSKKRKNKTYSHKEIYIYGKHIVFVYGRIFFVQILIAYYTCTLKLKSRKGETIKFRKKK